MFEFQVSPNTMFSWWSDLPNGMKKFKISRLFFHNAPLLSEDEEKLLLPQVQKAKRRVFCEFCAD